MKKRISVLTADLYLFQKIRLDAPDGVEVVLGECENPELALLDLDTAHTSKSGAVTMSRKSPADLKIPFALGTIELLLKNNSGDDSPLAISESDRCVYLRGEKIKLTDVEYALFSILFEKRGEYALREEILDTVWGGEKDAGVINVYVHYLREKLETHGEKIIISSRKCGYKIDEKFFGGKDA